jgi:circadian clock protein KaiC
LQLLPSAQRLVSIGRSQVSFLAEGARIDETGVIAAFEQHPHKARGHVVAGLIDSGRIGVIDTRAATLSVDEIAMMLIAEIRRLQASRVVIDSLSGFEPALAPTFRESLARMMSALASMQRYVEVESRLERVRAVVKVRASAHSNRLHLFHIDDDGIKIGAPLTANPYVGTSQQAGGRLARGIAALAARSDGGAAEIQRHAGRAVPGCQ